MKIQAISLNAHKFPNYEPPYEDVLAWPHRPAGRDSNGIDCLGVVIEMFKRAGFLLPDPKLDKQQALEFTDLFDVLPDSNSLRLFDIASFRNDSEQHVEVIIRKGLAISAREKRRVYTSKVNLLKRINGIKWYRVKVSELPI